MTKLTKKKVLHVAELSNLKLTPAEIKKITPQLDKIIEFVGTLSEVDTTDVASTSQSTGLTNVFREDVIKTDQALTQEEALSGSDTYNGFFKVPAILENRTSE